MHLQTWLPPWQQWVYAGWNRKTLEFLTFNCLLPPTPAFYQCQGEKAKNEAARRGRRKRQWWNHLGAVGAGGGDRIVLRKRWISNESLSLSQMRTNKLENNLGNHFILLFRSIITEEVKWEFTVSFPKYWAALYLPQNGINAPKKIFAGINGWARWLWMSFPT